MKNELNRSAKPTQTCGARWPLMAVVSTGLLTLILAVVAALTYVSAHRSNEASLHAALAQRHLQGYLRGVNEVLLTEGSTAARKLVQDSKLAFSVQVDTLRANARLAENVGALQDIILPGWAQVVQRVDSLLVMKSVSASDDDAMLAYGKISGSSETLVEALSGIESRAAPAAARATWQMLVQLSAAALLCLLFVLSVGRYVLQRMFDRLGDQPGQVRAVAMRIAAHDLVTPVDRPARRSTQRRDTLMDALADIHGNLSQVVGQVHVNTASLAQAAAEIAAGNQDLSKRTEQQATALERTTGSMTQLGSTVRQNADNARQASQLAAGAIDVAAKGDSVVGQMVSTMRGIQEASHKIAEIIGVIDDIAFQTNILALNAAVEAARAGDQGRGFAVVASEVRSLARRSAEAAKEIKMLIGSSVDRVEQGTQLAELTGSTVQEMLASIRRVADIVGTISQASSDQSAGVLQVAENVGQIDQATQQNAALAEQNAAAVENLRAQAQQLVSAVGVFRLGQGAVHAAG